MPTSPIMILPKSSSAEEFESICRDVLKLKYDMDFALYGRKGQKQYGIDLYAKSTNGSYIVVQCKNYYKSTFEKFRSQLCDDIESSKNSGFKIEKFIVMTALDRDIKVQKFISEYSAPFPVSVLFWDDIQGELCSNKKLLKKYYPHIDDDTEIPIRDRNEIISEAKIVKEAVKYIAENCSSYFPGYDEIEDNNIYSICVQIYSAVFNLKQKQAKYHLQLKEIKAVKPINKLVSNLPVFYDDTNDYTGCSMICTISDYKKYFLDDENSQRYIKWCDKIIKKIEKL